MRSQKDMGLVPHSLPLQCDLDKSLCLGFPTCHKGVSSRLG
jgi:hypothetical protein